ncbi:DUF4330 family protein [Halocatena halophila]|uniref:DUF4330 family protein n=1 Tax=Halocatena halophila TaxID=2814576 RepID=UPI002ED0A72F
MDLIDEEGNLFGRFNIFDALVVLFVAAIIVSGVTAAITPLLKGALKDGQTENDSAYATIDLGEQPSEVVDEIEVGDTFSNNGEVMSITDIYVGPNGIENTEPTRRIVLEASVPQQGADTNNDSFQLDGKPFKQGSSVSLQGKMGGLSGTVIGVDKNQSAGAISYPVQLKAEVSPSVANAIQSGDEYRINNKTVATVKNVTAVPTDEESHVVLGATIQVINRSNETYFGTIPVTIGSVIPLYTTDYSIDATVSHKGDFGPGTQRTQTATVLLENVTQSTAKAIEVGSTTTTGNSGTMTIRDKRIEPASITTESNSGTIQVQSHPTRKDVHLTVDMQVRESSNETRFRGNKLTIGSQVVVDLTHVQRIGTVEKFSNSSG